MLRTPLILVLGVGLFMTMACGDSTSSPASGAGGAGGDATGGGAVGGGSSSAGTPTVTECNDGIDNDGDGLVDWQMDLGCWSESDTTEAARSRDEESGFSTFDPSPDSVIVYVSASEGDDANDGLTPETAVATPARGAELVRDGSNDFLLFRRGDTWRAMDLGPDRIVRRFKSGLDAAHPLVVASYGDSKERPRLEIDKDLIDDDGHERAFLAVLGLSLVSYPKTPGDAAFNGEDGGGFRFVGPSHDLLFEDNYLEYDDFVVQNTSRVEIRRNVVWRSYHVGTCAYNMDGTRNPNGNNEFRPSGIFAGNNDDLLIEENVWDENGWNPDVLEACATIYNHDLYLSGNDRLVVRDNLVLRASSIGLKMSANASGDSDDIVIEGNVFAEGEIGLSMGGNDTSPYRFLNARVIDNVFTDIGRSQPTKRTLTWYVDLIDNDKTEVAGNLLVNQPPLGNAYGIHITGGSERSVDVHDNLLYGLQRQAFRVGSQAAWETVTFRDNEVVGETDLECLVNVEGAEAPLTFTGNAYRSAAAASAWFCINGAKMDLSAWKGSHEADATLSAATPPEPTRNLDSYASVLGLGTTLADFAAETHTLSRHRWRPELTAREAGNYIREGFGLAPR